MTPAPPESQKRLGMCRDVPQPRISSYAEHFVIEPSASKNPHRYRQTPTPAALRLNLGASEQIIEAPEAIPAVSIRFQEYMMSAGAIGFAVLIREQVDQHLSRLVVAA